MRNILIIALVAVAAVFTSCGSKTPLTDSQKIYAGKWVANDGTWLQIYNNGGGDFKQSNSNVTGGSATITDNTITIGLFGINSEYSIDKVPFEENGVWLMELDGNTYQKE